eukprot:16436235-Heterocapsa_arctica.AAC.1
MEREGQTREDHVEAQDGVLHPLAVLLQVRHVVRLPAHHLADTEVQPAAAVEDRGLDPAVGRLRRLHDVVLQPPDRLVRQEVVHERQMEGRLRSRYQRVIIFAHRRQDPAVRRGLRLRLRLRLALALVEEDRNHRGDTGRARRDAQHHPRDGEPTSQTRQRREVAEAPGREGDDAHVEGVRPRLELPAGRRARLVGEVAAALDGCPAVGAAVGVVSGVEDRADEDEGPEDGGRREGGDQEALLPLALDVQDRARQVACLRQDLLQTGLLPIDALLTPPPWRRRGGPTSPDPRPPIQIP